MLGTVKWFNSEKGYGFLKTKLGEDVYIHFTNIICSGYKTLVKNQTVIFDLSLGTNGFYAKNLFVVKDVNK